MIPNNHGFMAFNDDNFTEAKTEAHGLTPDTTVAP